MLDWKNKKPSEMPRYLKKVSEENDTVLSVVEVESYMLTNETVTNFFVSKIDYKIHDLQEGWIRASSEEFINFINKKNGQDNISKN